MRRHLIIGCIALLASIASPAVPMGADPKELNLSYDGEAYRAWPIIYGFRFNGVLNVAPESVRCCIEDNRAPGGGGGTTMGILYEGDIPEISLNVTWIEVHSDITYKADVTFSTDEIKGWAGGTVIVTFSFRPGGELVLYTDGPALAATRSSGDEDIRSGADMAAVLLAPGLGRAHRRGDFVKLRRVCGKVDPDPPEAFRNGRAQFGPQTLAQIDANRSLPLPEPNCERGQ